LIGYPCNHSLFDAFSSSKTSGFVDSPFPNVKTMRFVGRVKYHRRRFCFLMMGADASCCAAWNGVLPFKA
jgi:hypothetical protein